MAYLVTGVAGFIGYHVTRQLLERGEPVIGIDNLNDYYAPALKSARLKALRTHHNTFRFIECDIADSQALSQAVNSRLIHKIIHLAAQVGVRYSIDHPDSYVQSNLCGHLNMLEVARHMEGLERMVYASSSSVYGGNTKLPFSEADAVDHPISLYAATKRADELMSEAYAHLYGLSLIGLRFFTVYGPWGRPDMAVWRFTKAIYNEKPIQIFNHGRMRRDFTYIDDIVAGILATIDKSPRHSADKSHRVYNIGNHRSEQLMDLVGLIEQALNRKADKQFLPMQAGDIYETFADIEAIGRDYGFEPATPLSMGIERFVQWFVDQKANQY